MLHKNGILVRQIVEVIQGQIVARRLNESYEEMEYQVDSTDADGTVHSRWLRHSQIEAVPVAAVADAAAAADVAVATVGSAE